MGWCSPPTVPPRARLTPSGPRRATLPRFVAAGGTTPPQDGPSFRRASSGASPGGVRRPYGLYFIHNKPSRRRSWRRRLSRCAGRSCSANDSPLFQEQVRPCPSNGGAFRARQGHLEWVQPILQGRNARQVVISSRRLRPPPSRYRHPAWPTVFLRQRPVINVM